MDVKEIIRYLFSIRKHKYSNKSDQVKYVVIAISVLCVCRLPKCSANSLENISENVKIDVHNKTINESSDSQRSWSSSQVEAKFLNIIKIAGDYLNNQMDASSGIEVARTFGRPIRKLQAALLPVMFKLGVISTLIFMTFILAVKGVGIGLMLLFFKMGAAFGKLKFDWHGHHDHHGGWSPHSKEVHFHVIAQPQYHGHGHGHGQGYEAPYHGGHEGWSRTDVNANPGYNKISPYSQGPNIINTPYGHYVRTGDPTAPSV